ncbi:MAG TPA: matrixin family metalloprotease [Gemmatimonadaceae bacterium]
MKRTDLIPVFILLPLLGFVAAQVVRTPGAPESRATVPVVARTEAGRLGAAPAAQPSRAVSSEPLAAAGAMPRDVSEIRERLSAGAAGTYIDEILVERDSALARWPERVSHPVRVWVGDGEGITGWSNTFPARVRGAFQEWSELGIPVRFEFVADSADADVHVSWIDHFDTPISGKTLWARDRSWWIVSANITLALHHNGGQSLDDSSVKAIALHEVGHLLGLDHTSDTTDIMTARVRVRDLSNADRATMKLLYTLPPGSVREGK